MEKYIALIKNLGAKDAKVIDAKSVVTAPWTIFKCQFGCRRYGKSLCCPPHSPNYRQTKEIIDSYKHGILFTLHEGEKTTEIAVAAAKKLFIDGYYKAIAFGSGPCKICKECNLQGCNFPGKTAPAMEACGIDVFETVKKNGYLVEVLKNNSELQNHFGLVLIE